MNRYKNGLRSGGLTDCGLRTWYKTRTEYKMRTELKNCCTDQ